MLTVDECSSCSEMEPLGECPKSKRECGHHCNCIWTQDICHFCGGEINDDGEFEPQSSGGLQEKSEMRQLTDHIVSGDQAVQLQITVADEPGAGGANHAYQITGGVSSQHPVLRHEARRNRD